MVAYIKQKKYHYITYCFIVIYIPSHHFCPDRMSCLPDIIPQSRSLSGAEECKIFRELRNGKGFLRDKGSSVMWMKP